MGIESNTFPCSSTMRFYQCLILTLILQDISGVARVKRSAIEKLRNPGTYIVHFKDNTTDAQLQQFTKQLIRRFTSRPKFEAKIITEYPYIKCLTARLSEKALKWVRITYTCLAVSTDNRFAYCTSTYTN